MSVLALVFTILFLISAFLVGLVYTVGVLFWHRIPAEPFQVKIQDWFSWILIAICTGLATGNLWEGEKGYLGFLAFLPFLALKFWISKQDLTASRSGFWIEVKWLRLLPKGLRPEYKAQMAEMEKSIPKDAHIVVFRPAAVLFLKYYFYKARKDKEKMLGQVRQMKVTAAEADANFKMIEDLAKGVLDLPKGGREEKVLNNLGKLVAVRH